MPVNRNATGCLQAENDIVVTNIEEVAVWVLRNSRFAGHCHLTTIGISVWKLPRRPGFEIHIGYRSQGQQQSLSCDDIPQVETA